MLGCRKTEYHLNQQELIDNEGTLRQENGAHMSHKEIVKMDWLLDNVEGKVPSFSELKDEALPLVLLQGDVAQNEES